jgi:cytochrome c553
MLIAAAPVVAEEAEAEPRLDVLERIKPIGEVTIIGQPVAIAAPEAAPADGSAPAADSAPVAEGDAPAADSAPAAAPADGGALYAAKGCAACHGPKGHKTLTPTYPKVGGQAKDYLVAQMKDIKSGSRSNGQSAVMIGIISQVSEAEMGAIADWLSKQ